MTENTRSDLATNEDENLTIQKTSFNVPYLVHSDGKKGKIKVLSALIFCYSHSPSNSFLSSSFFINLYWAHFVISIFYLHREKYFCLHSQGKYFHFSVLTIYLFPGISLRGPESHLTSDQVWPGPEWRPEWGTAWRGHSPVTEPEPPEDTPSPESSWWTVLGRGLNWDVSRINTEITSLALILVMVTVYGFVAILIGRDTLLWYCRDYSAYQSYEIGANICPASWYMWPSISLQQTETVMNQGRESKLSSIHCYNLWPSEVFITHKRAYF